MDIKEYKEFRLDGLIDKHFDDKINATQNYLSICNIREVTVGFSGGADSLLVLFILVMVKRQYLPYLKIHAVTISSDDSRETSFNSKDVDYAYNNNWWLGYVERHDIKVPANNRLNDLFLPEKYGVSRETIHQSYYQYMYNILYTHAQISGGITVGTTNLDEIAYAGWFGKNSDMVVDLQIISDMHKFEIYEVMKKYDLSVASAPCGDMPDALDDVEYFGMSYDELSHYSWCRCNGKDEFIDRDIFSKIEVLHINNRHKYFGQNFNPVFIKNPDRFFIYNINMDIMK